MPIKLSLIFLALLNLSNANLLMISQKVTHVKTKTQSHIYSKFGSPFSVETNSEIIDFDSGKLKVVVDLKGDFSAEKVRYKWILPENVELGWGIPSGIINQLDGHESVRLQIELVKLNLEINQNITLLIERDEQGVTLGSSFIIASRKDLTEEYQKTPEENQDLLTSRAFSEEPPIRKKLIY